MPVWSLPLINILFDRFLTDFWHFLTFFLRTDGRTNLLIEAPTRNLKIEEFSFRFDEKNYLVCKTWMVSSLHLWKALSTMALLFMSFKVLERMRIIIKDFIMEQPLASSLVVVTVGLTLVVSATPRLFTEMISSLPGRLHTPALSLSSPEAHRHIRCLSMKFPFIQKIII